MLYFIDFSPAAERELSQWGRETALRLLNKIKILEMHPHKGKPLGRSHSGKLFRELIVGKFRVYYSLSEGKLEIEKIVYAGRATMHRIGNKQSQRRDIAFLRKVI